MICRNRWCRNLSECTWLWKLKRWAWKRTESFIANQYHILSALVFPCSLLISKHGHTCLILLLYRIALIIIYLIISHNRSTLMLHFKITLSLLSSSQIFQTHPLSLRIYYHFLCSSNPSYIFPFCSLYSYLYYHYFLTYGTSI